MISFVSTFPPIICGIGAYSKCLVSELPEGTWKVISPKISEFESSGKSCENHVSYTISLSNPHLPSHLEGELLWFQHAFGMWGDPSIPFIKLIREAKKKKNKVIATLQALHFQSTETPYGFHRREYRLLKEVLPFLDALPVFTNGTYQAITKAFPEYKNKVTVLRHGVNIYPKVPQDEARKRFLDYLIYQSKTSKIQREKIKSLYEVLLSEKTVLLGSFGFITQDRDPLSLFQLRQRLQQKLPEHKVIAIYGGIIQKRADKPPTETLPLLKQLKSIHDGRYNLFIEDYIPDEILPFAFGTLDFSVIWYHQATQSGRMAHAQGTGTCVVGRDIEGVGETLKLAGLPATNTLDELSERIKRLVLEPDLKAELEQKSLDYADRFSYASQAQKHLLVGQTICSGKQLPILDRLEEYDESYPREAEGEIAK